MKKDREYYSYRSDFQNHAGNIFELAAGKYDLVDFTRYMLESGMLARCCYDVSIFSQSESYFFEVLRDELKEKGKEIKAYTGEFSVGIEREIGYWLGYMLIAWVFDNAQDIGAPDIGPSIAKEYDLNRIYYAYGPLHTQDIDYAVRVIQEEMRIQN